MSSWPRISLVTPSFNQGRYIAETIESIARQDYPNLEHIVIDGGSTDETLEVLGRYPHLRVTSEKDRGHADALNKGFSMATGTIWGFVNSDDTLLPGALRRVAQEIDASRDRHVVMGRCRFVDEGGRFVGIEHPSHFQGHRRVLEIWKGHTIPQPAVFWTPEVWRTCGPARLGEVHVDYDLFCRFSRRYSFHFVDQVLATYRLHAESQTSRWGEAERLEDSIRLSRQYWGSPFSVAYWQLAISLEVYRLDRIGRARRLFENARELRRRHQLPQAIGLMAASAGIAPEVAFYTVAYPRLRSHAQGAFSRVLDRLAPPDSLTPQTAVYLDHTDLWPDCWAGPRLITTAEVTTTAKELIISGQIPRIYLQESPVFTILVDGRCVDERRIDCNDEFDLVVSLPRPLGPGAHEIEVRANAWFVSHHVNKMGDYRPLAWRVNKLTFPPAE